ncbi:MAG: efflux RND transporter periplasmic adaptor subunit [Thermostichus sp. DG02_5_bins_236]
MKTQLGVFRRPTSSGWNWGGVGFAVLLLSVGGVGGWVLGSRTQPTQTEVVSSVAVQESVPLPFKTVEVSPQSVSSERILVGSLEAVESVSLSSRIVGRILEFPVQEGQRVAAGSLIARLDVSDIQADQDRAQAQRQQAEAQLQQAQANRIAVQAGLRVAEAVLHQTQAQKREAEAELSQARLHQQRMQVLHAEGAVTQAQLDQASTQVAVILARIAQIEAGIQQAEQGIAQVQAQIAQAESGIPQAQAAIAQAQAVIDQSQANLEYGRLLAPFDGVITHKYGEVGSLAGPGQPLVHLESTERLRFSVTVPESQVSQIHVGQSVPMAFDNLNQTVEGTIQQIIPSADPVARTVVVKVDVPALAGGIPGLLGRLTVLGQTRQALLIPQESVLEQFGITGVYRWVAGKAVFTPVVLGSRYGNQVEIHAGIQPGEQVIQDAAAVQTGSL